MSKTFSLERDGWLSGASEDDEARTSTRLKIRTANSIVTRNYRRRSGGETDAINVSLKPLADFVAANWWPLLHEPLRNPIDVGFRARHRLDAAMRGYAFPALAMCSAGDDAVAFDWFPLSNPHAQIDFVTQAPAEFVQIDRQAVEFEFIDMIETVLERLSVNLAESLSDNWTRVKASIADPDERSYCTIAGRLGFDPYDTDSPDLETILRDLPEALVGDVSDAVKPEEIKATADWLRDVEGRFALFPEIEVGAFGECALDNVDDPAWTAGELSALKLRQNTSMRGIHPKEAVDEILGAAVYAEGALVSAPRAVTGLIRRSGNRARISPVAKSARQRRFRASAAAYLAWTTLDGQDRAATVAITRRQQASRAFAAELLSPKDVLVERATPSGFDSDDLEELATEFVCPFETVMWQAHRAGISLPGVDLPYGSRIRFA